MERSPNINMVPMGTPRRRFDFDAFDRQVGEVLAEYDRQVGETALLETVGHHPIHPRCNGTEPDVIDTPPL